MAENNMEIVKRQLWTIADSLRSNFGLTRTLDIILLFVFLRRMECIFAPVHGKVQKVYNDFKYDLDYNDMDIKIREVIGSLRFYTTSSDTMAPLLGKGYLDSVAGFEHYFRTYDHETLSYLELYGAYSILNELAYRKLLVYVTDLFCKINLGEDVADDEYRELVNEFLRKKADSKNSGEYYTPWAFSRLLCQLIVNGNNKVSAPAIYDPVCGSAKLLNDVALQFNASGATPEVYGQDIMPSCVGFANLFANGLKQSNVQIVSGDTLVEDKFADKKFDYIVADLPFNKYWDSNLVHHADSRFMSYPTKDDATLLFVQHIVSKMKGNGRAVFTCLPKVFMTVDKGSEAIRSWLLQEDVLETIFIMPAGVVRNLAVPSCICILDKNKPEDRKNKIQIIDCNKILTRKQGAQILLDGLALQSLWEAYMRKDSLMDNETFIGFQLEVNQPLRNEDGSLRLKEGGKVVDKKKTLTVNIPSTEKDIIGYVRRNYLNHADPDAWVNVSSLQRFCSIDLLRLTISNVDTIHLADIEADANKIKRQMEKLLEDIFDNDEVTGMVSEPMPVRKNTCMLNALVKVVRQSSRIKRAVLLTEGEYPVLSLDYLRDTDATNNLLFPENPQDYALVEENDTLIVMSGTNAGEVLRGKKGCLAGTLAKFECISNSILPEYLYFLLKTKESEIRKMARGMGPKSINLKDLSSISVQFPSLEEQQIVVDNLSQKIASIDKLLPMLGGKAKQTMQDYRQALIVDTVLCE